jgi:SAM-dependent methyltransferase
MRRDAAFWNRIAGKYARMKVPDEASYQRKLEITRDFLTPDSDVLEFGCGTGSTAIAHAPHARHILALDISPEMLRIARDKAAAAGIANVTFEEEGIEDYEAPEGSYDMVMCHSLLHLLDDRDAAIAKIHGLLKPGGIFISSTMCISDGLGFMRPILPLGRILGLFPVVKVFSSDTLRGAIESAGFEIVEDWRPGKRKATFLVARKPDAGRDPD